MSHERDSEELRIQIVMDSLKASRCVPEGKKRELAGDLEFAQMINGNPDPAQQASKRVLIAGVDREIEAYERHATLKNDLSVIVKGALEEHTKNCVLVLMKTKAEEEEEVKRRALAEAESQQPEAAPKEDGSLLRFGKAIEAKGVAATVMAIVVAFSIVVIGWVGWQNSKTRDLIKQSMSAAVQEALSAK